MLLHLKQNKYFSMDEREWIGVFIRGYELYKKNNLVFLPFFTVYLADKETGEYTAKVSHSHTKDLALKFLGSITNKNFARLEPFSPSINKPLLLEEKISSLDSNQKILFFDICRIIHERGSEESDKKRTAWAFLVPVASDGTRNINEELKLQLYQVPKNCKISHQTCNIHHLYKHHKLKKFPGILRVKIEGVKREVDSGQDAAPVICDHDEEKSLVRNGTTEIQYPQMFQWSRLPTQSCKIPNQLHMILSFGHRGTSCVRFDRTGSRIAVASAERIYIYDVKDWSELYILKGHDGFIYDIDWAENNSYLLSVSNDCSCIVWNIAEKVQHYILPHPCYIYCGKWIDSDSTLVTGCTDHLIRCWKKNGDNFELIQDIRGHSGFITAMTIQETSTLISGDSQGSVIIHKLIKNQWVVVKHLHLNEASLGIIDSINVCNSRTRIIITSRSKGSFMVDINASIIIHKYKSVGNVVLRFVPCLSPCGSLFFAFCQNGEIGVWNAHTGKHMASYQHLFPVRGLSEICGYMHYNPFEHMLAIGALDNDHPVLILKYGEKDESGKLGLVTYTIKNERINY